MDKWLLEDVACLVRDEHGITLTAIYRNKCDDLNVQMFLKGKAESLWFELDLLIRDAIQQRFAPGCCDAVEELYKDEMRP